MADGLPAMRLKDIVRIDNARAVGLPSNSRMEPSTARASTNEGSNIIWFRLTCEVARFCMCSQSHFQRKGGGEGIGYLRVFLHSQPQRPSWNLSSGKSVTGTHVHTTMGRSLPSGSQVARQRVSRKEGSAFISGVISDQSARIGSGASGWGSRYQPIHLELAGGDVRPAVRLRSMPPPLPTVDQFI